MPIIEFIAGFIFGFILCAMFMVISILTLREIIFKYGKTVKRVVENELNRYYDATLQETEIIYPDNTLDNFKKSDKLEDLLN